MKKIIELDIIKFVNEDKNTINADPQVHLAISGSSVNSVDEMFKLIKNALKERGYGIR